MMRRETAYRLAGRNHQHEDVLGDALRYHEVRLAEVTEDQLALARAVLGRLPELLSKEIGELGVFQLTYDLAHYSARVVEQCLTQHGVVLDSSLHARIKRTLVYYCEDTLRRNARAPDRLIKQSSQVYVKAYEHHLHGDHDETPPELREFK